MGKPKFSRKKYETPSHPWQEDRIKEENELIKKYGLKNKKEIWKAETRLRRYRGQARSLLAKITTGDEQSKKESQQLLLHLSRMNILPPNSTLDDVLTLNTEAILSRRLQTLTYLKGLANTPRQARQLIAHGHIAVGGRKVTIPGYMVTKDEESEISYVDKSPLNDPIHPARPKGEFSSFSVKKEEKPKETITEEKKSEEAEKEEKTSTEKKVEKSEEKPAVEEKETKPETETKETTTSEEKKEEEEKPVEAESDKKSEDEKVEEVK